MWEFLSSPLDIGRPHAIEGYAIWHARIMFLAWGVIAPLAVLIARYFKVLPGQNWPQQLDNQFWWRCHWLGQSIVLVLTIIAIVMMLVGLERTGPHIPNHWHGWLGYLVVILVCLQALLGYFRGTKGGPTDPKANGSLDGDHFNMTPRRRRFEALHKTFGYLTLLLAAIAVGTGLWMTNSPRWMWLAIVLWWLLLIAAAISCQRRGLARDTYQAIWGPDPSLPGNRQPSAGWGTHRLTAGNNTNKAK